MISAIYSIKCIKTKKIYIGSAVNVQKRWNEHIADLKRNRHHSVMLQRAWNKYGQKAFVFRILTLVKNPKNLLKKEQYYLDKYKSYLPKKGFNINPIAGSRLGKTHSLLTRKLISKKTMGRPAWNKGLKLGPISESHKEKLRAVMQGNSYRKGIKHTLKTLKEMKRARRTKKYRQHMSRQLKKYNERKNNGN